MRPRSLILALALSACGMGNDPNAQAPPDGGGNDPADAPGACQVSLTSSPTEPVAVPLSSVRVRSFVVNAPAVPTYEWRVVFQGIPLNFTTKEGDPSQGTFLAHDAGIYQVDLELPGLSKACPPASLTINVRPPGAQIERLRIRVVSPRANAAPPHEEGRDVPGGAEFFLSDVSVTPGRDIDAIVAGPGGGVPAYLRFAPNVAPDAIVEAFSDVEGRAPVQLRSGMYSVLVVPSLPGIAPRRVRDWSTASPQLTVDAGAPIAGEVRDPQGAPIRGAQVQLTIDGVPSTLAATDAGGNFLVRASITSGPVTVEVTPPDASGLPRLAATSSEFDLTQSLAIRYDASLVRRDLAGTRVLRAGSPVSDAWVTVVGAIAAIGKVTAGAPADASGEVRLAARTDGSGALPAMLVPAAALSAVITVGPGDLAVTALDTSDSAPASLDAPPMRSITMVVAGPQDAPLPGAVLDAVPVGALAMAGVPVLRATARSAGKLAAALAEGGRYELRFRDPDGRAAPLVVTDRTTSAIESAYRLPRAQRITGTVTYDGRQPMANASVQILCDACKGIERARPIAEGASDAVGEFNLAVPDPGTR